MPSSARERPVITARAREFLPSPPWGRGWRATGAVISRGETGEGVSHREYRGDHESHATPPDPVNARTWCTLMADGFRNTLNRNRTSVRHFGINL